MKRLLAFSLILFALAGCSSLSSFGQWAIGNGPDTDPPYVDQFAGFDNMTPEAQLQFINWYQQMLIRNELQWQTQLMMQNPYRY